MLGALGRKAVAEKMQRVPISRAVRTLREHLDISEEVLATILQTSAATVEEFEAGTRAPAKQDLEVMLGLMRKTIHKLPELELAFSMALEQASQRLQPGKQQQPAMHSKDEEDGHSSN
jgi:DNA-binding transcriptional regulator YiaG